MVEIDDRFIRRVLNWAQLTDHSFAGSLTSLNADLSPRQVQPEAMASGGMLRAQEAWTSALDLWQDEEDAFEFLTRKHAMLEDQRPIIAVINSNEGLRSVQSIMGRLRYGSAA